MFSGLGRFLPCREQSLVRSQAGQIQREVKDMNQYEMVVILRADVEEEDRKKVLDRLIDAIDETGKVLDLDEWGNRKLAYPIDFKKDGYYVVLTYEAEPETVQEVERRARILDNILRYLTVKKEA